MALKIVVRQQSKNRTAEQLCLYSSQATKWAFYSTLEMMTLDFDALLYIHTYVLTYVLPLRSYVCSYIGIVCTIMYGSITVGNPVAKSHPFMLLGRINS